MKARLRNYGLWVAVAALIVLISQDVGFALPGHYDAIVTKLLEILIFLGLINNPTTKNPGFLDDLPQEPSKITRINR